MTDQPTTVKREQLREKPKGSIALQAGIVIMTFILIWSILGPKKEMEFQRNLEALARAKMKVLFNLQYQYLTVDTNYTTDQKKLANFALTANQQTVPDSLFRPVMVLYKRFENHRETLENLSIKEFKKIYMDSLFYNPMNGEKFIIETTVSAGRKTFNIKPFTDEEASKKFGAVINGEITWNEKADILQ